MINAHGVAALLAASLVAAILHLVTGGPGSELSHIEIGASYLLIGGAAEWYGFRPRIAWIPAWVLGLLVLLYGLWTTVGWVVLLSLALVGGLGLFAVCRRMWAGQSAALAEAARVLHFAGRARTARDYGEAEEPLTRALVLPVAGHTADLCTHNLDVLDAAMDMAGPCLPAESLVRLVTYAGALEAGRLPGAGRVDDGLARQAAEALEMLAPASELPDRHEFGRRVRDAAGSGADYDPRDFVVRAGRELALHEHYPRFLSGDPAERDDLVLGLAASLREGDGGTPRLCLRPRGRASGWFSLITDELCLAVELPGLAPRPLTGEDLHHFGPDPESDVAAAVDALRALGPPPLRELAPGVWHGALPEVSRALAAPDLVAGFAVRGRTVAAAPLPDLLMLSGDHDLPGLVRLVAATEAFLGHPRFLETGLLVLEGGRWRSLELAENHPAAAHLGRLRALVRTLQYGRQHRDAHGPLIRYRVRFEDGVAIPFCVWDGALPALVPEVREVVVVRSGKTETVRWSGLDTSALDPPLWPPRWRVGG